MSFYELLVDSKNAREKIEKKTRDILQNHAADVLNEL